MGLFTRLSFLSEAFDILCRQAIGGAEECGHFAGVPPDDLRQVGGHSSGQGEQLIRVLSENFCYPFDLLLSGGIELIALDFREIGRTHADLLSEAAQADLPGFAQRTNCFAKLPFGGCHWYSPARLVISNH
jgi:hypothetical protein